MIKLAQVLLLLSSWISVIMGFISLIVYSPFIFKEFDVATEERERALAKFSALRVRHAYPPGLQYCSGGTPS